MNKTICNINKTNSSKLLIALRASIARYWKSKRVYAFILINDTGGNLSGYFDTLSCYVKWFKITAKGCTPTAAVDNLSAIDWLWCYGGN